MFCPNCGSKMNDGASFCSNCGWKAGSSSMTKVKISNVKFIIPITLVVLCIAVFFMFKGKSKKYEYKKGDTIRNVIPFKYNIASDFFEGLAFVVYEGPTMEASYLGFIDKKGKEIKTGIKIEDLQYDGADEDNVFCEGLWAVSLNDQWGFIDKTGKEVLPLIYDNIGGIFSEGLAPVKKDNKWGFIDKTGKEVLPLIYDYNYVGTFIEGLAPVEKDDKWGFIDKTGKEVISPKYDEVHDFCKGLCVVKSNDKWGYISYLPEYNK